MKTPEEIKKGLECCYGDKERRFCEMCPFGMKTDGIFPTFVCSVFDAVGEYALSYIQQLESRLAQVERERDAAVRDLQRFSFCEDCKHLGKSKKRNPCRECQENYKEKPNWQWRGVCPENTKEE